MKKRAHITSSIKKSNKGEAVSQGREERKEPLKTSRSRGLFSSDQQIGRSAKKSQQRVVCVCVCWLSFSLLDCKHSENRNYLFLPVLPTVLHSAPWMWERLNKCLLEKESKEGRGAGEEEREGGERKRKESRNLPVKNKTLSLPVVQLPSNPLLRLLLARASSPSAWPHREAHLSQNTPVFLLLDLLTPYPSLI